MAHIPTLYWLLPSLLIAALLFWRTKTQIRRVDRTRTALIQGLVPPPLEKVDFQSLKTLPAPVQQYLRKALKDGQPMICTAYLRQKGEMKLTPTSEKWTPFTAKQTITPHPPAFLWDATIKPFFLMNIHVQDQFKEGKGSGKVSLLNLLHMEQAEDRYELNQGALYRYLAEAAWYPTALLPQAGVTWEPINNQKALAKLTVQGITAEIEFEFDKNNDLVGIYTEKRFGKFDKEYKLYPWQGTFSKHKTIDGMRVPTEAKVGWHLPDGYWHFWYGEIESLTFTYCDHPFTSTEKSHESQSNA